MYQTNSNIPPIYSQETHYNYVKNSGFCILTSTGKERDSETGYSYFGARYYDSDLMTGWLSVDPMADKYPSLSPYAYCAWNPIKLVDPDGRDVWEIDRNGRVIDRIEDKTQDAFHIVEKNENGKYQRVDNLSIRFDYGTIVDQRNPEVQIIRKGIKSKVQLTLFEVKGDENATKLFEFMGQHGITTDVEWSHLKIGTQDSEKNIVVTSGNYNFSAVNGYIFNMGYTIREDNHSHVTSSKVSDADKEHAKKLHSKFPNTPAYNYFPDDGYTQYDFTGKIEPEKKTQMIMIYEKKTSYFYIEFIFIEFFISSK